MLEMNSIGGLRKIFVLIEEGLGKLKEKNISF